MKINQTLFASTFITRLPMVFEPGKAGWKLAADGKTIEMKDGNPVWINADGTEQVLQQDTIARLNSEAAGHRKAAENAAAELKKFTGLDPEKAKAALDIVTKLDQKKLIDAGEVDKVVNGVKTEYETKLVEEKKAREEIQGRYDGMQIGNIFSVSDFVREQVAIPRDMFEAYFRSNFKVGKDGIEVYGKDGNRLMSKAKIGEYADPHEGLEILVNSHPQKDVILKPSGHSGSGNNGNGGHRPGQRVVKRTEFDQLPPAEQAALAGKMRTGEVSIVD